MRKISPQEYLDSVPEVYEGTVEEVDAFMVEKWDKRYKGLSPDGVARDYESLRQRLQGLRSSADRTVATEVLWMLQKDNTLFAHALGTSTEGTEEAKTIVMAQMIIFNDEGKYLHSFMNIETPKSMPPAKIPDYAISDKVVPERFTKASFAAYWRAMFQGKPEDTRKWAEDNVSKIFVRHHPHENQDFEGFVADLTVARERFVVDLVEDATVLIQQGNRLAARVVSLVQAKGSPNVRRTDTLQNWSWNEDGKLELHGALHVVLPEGQEVFIPAHI